MPIHTARPSRTSASRRPSARRSRTTTPRRGVAGGWLQRRQPQPSRKSKATAAAKRALRKRGEDAHEPTAPAAPPVTGTPPADVPPAV